MFKLLKKQKPPLPPESSSSSSGDAASSVYVLGASSPLHKAHSMSFIPHKTVDSSIDEIQNDSFDPFETPEPRKVRKICSLPAIIFPPSKDERLVHFAVPNSKRYDSPQETSSSCYSEATTNHKDALQYSSIEEYRENENTAQSEVSRKLTESDSSYFEQTSNEDDVFSSNTKVPTAPLEPENEEPSTVKKPEPAFAPGPTVLSYGGGSLLPIPNLAPSSDSDSESSTNENEKLDELRKRIVDNLSIETNYFVPLSKDPLVFLGRLDHISVEIKEMAAKKEHQITELMNHVAELEAKDDMTTVVEQIKLLQQSTKEAVSVPFDEFKSALDSHHEIAATLKAACHEISTVQDKLGTDQPTDLLKLQDKLDTLLRKVAQIADIVESSSTFIVDTNNHLSTVEDVTKNLHSTYNALEAHINQLKFNSISNTTDTKQLASQINEYISSQTLRNIKDEVEMDRERKKQVEASSELAHQLIISQKNLQITYQNCNSLQEENRSLNHKLETEIARSRSLEKDIIYYRDKYNKNIQSSNKSMQTAHNEALEMAECIRRIAHENRDLHNSNVLTKYCLDQLIEGVFSYLLSYYDKDSHDRIKELISQILKKPCVFVEDMKVVSELVHTFQRGVLLLTEAFAESEMQLETEFKRRIAGQDATLRKLAHLMELRLNEALIQ